MSFLKRYLSALSSNLKPINGPHQTQGKLQLLVDLTDGLKDSELLISLSLNAYQFYQVFLFHPTFKNYQD